MHRSSESLAALGAALAKARVALVNPEKSLTAMIGPARAGEAARTFPLRATLEQCRQPSAFVAGRNAGRCADARGAMTIGEGGKNA
jgi:hypothetical protein